MSNTDGQDTPNCPKCRTLHPENCHSMYCPMRGEALYTPEHWKTGGTNENFGTMCHYSTAIFDGGELVARSFAHSYDEAIERAKLISNTPALQSEVERLRDELARANNLSAANAGIAIDFQKELAERTEILFKVEQERDGLRAKLEEANAEIEQYHTRVTDLSYSEEQLVKQRDGLRAELAEKDRQIELYKQNQESEDQTMTREEVWKLIDTFRKAGWYDDEFLVEIDRLKADCDSLREQAKEIYNAANAFVHVATAPPQAWPEIKAVLEKYK